MGGWFYPVFSVVPFCLHHMFASYIEEKAKVERTYSEGTAKAEHVHV